MDFMTAELRTLQSQLSTAIRAHRNLVGRTSLCPGDPNLQQKVQAAEKLIVRIYQAQKPLLEQYKKECEIRRTALSAKNGQRLLKDRAKTVDEVLDDGVRHRFCPSTLQRWDNSVGGLSPEKKRKMNFLGLFDLVTPKLGTDIVESKAPHRKRREELVNTDFSVLLGYPIDPNAAVIGCKRFRTAAAAAAAASAAAAATSKSQPTLAASSPGILTRSSRRTRGRDSAASTSAANLTAAEDDKSPMDCDDAQRESANADGSSDAQFCCATCLRVVPAPRASSSAKVGLRCSVCNDRGASRASGVIGLPPPSASSAAAPASDALSAVPAAELIATRKEEFNPQPIDVSNASPSDSLAAAEMENKSLMQVAERLERSLLSQEQTRQMLVEKNCRAEKKLEGLLAQFSKVNGM